MPRKNADPNVEATPHFDGKKENIINDSTATASTKMGIQVDTKAEFAQERNPLNHIPLDLEMQRFEHIMRGNKIEE
ncbi:MAG: hypothetical protein ACE3JQ_03555 [Paenisporosarcina sp.]